MNKSKEGIQAHVVVRTITPLGAWLLQVKSRSIADDREQRVCNSEMSGISGAPLETVAYRETMNTLSNVLWRETTSLSSRVLTFGSRCDHNPGH
jgi:hypothetical protein